MSVNWTRQTSRGIPIPPTVQEQPEVEAQATEAGQEYQYPDAEDCATNTNSAIVADQLISEDEPIEGYGRPRSAPSSDHSGWFPWEGNGRPLSAGGAARRLQAAMKRKMSTKEDDASEGYIQDAPHGNGVEAHGDYFQQYPQSGSNPRSQRTYDHDRYSRCRYQDLEIEDYFSDSSSSASEEDEILYDASIEDPDRVKHLPGFNKNDFEAELENEQEKLENEIERQEDNDASLRSKEFVNYKQRQRLSVDFNCKQTEGSQQLLYTNGNVIDRFDNLTYHRTGNEETTSVYLHEPVKSIYTLDNMKVNALQLNNNPKKDRQKLSNEQTKDTNLQNSKLTDSQDRSMSGKHDVDTVQMVLGKPILTRSKLAPTKVTDDSERGRVSTSQGLVSETRTPIRILALANQPNNRENENAVSISSTRKVTSNSSSSKTPKKMIGVVSIISKTDLKPSREEESPSRALVPNKAREAYKECMDVSRSLAQSLEVGRMKFRLVANQVKKKQNNGIR